MFDRYLCDDHMRVCNRYLCIGHSKQSLGMCTTEIFNICACQGPHGIRNINLLGTPVYTRTPHFHVGVPRINTGDNYLCRERFASRKLFHSSNAATSWPHARARHISIQIIFAFKIHSSGLVNVFIRM